MTGKYGQSGEKAALRAAGDSFFEIANRDLKKRTGWHTVLIGLARAVRGNTGA